MSCVCVFGLFVVNQKTVGGRGWVLPAELFEPGTLCLSQREKETRRNPAFFAKRHLKVSHGSLSSVSTVRLPFNLSFFLSFALKKQDAWWNKKKNNNKKKKTLLNMSHVAHFAKKVRPLALGRLELDFYFQRQWSQVEYEDRWICIFFPRSFSF